MAVLLILPVTAVPDPRTPATTTDVWLGSEGTTRLPLPTAELGAPLDLARDAATGHLYAVTHTGNRFQVRRWTPAGQPDATWTLPEKWLPSSVLHVVNGELRAVVGDDSTRFRGMTVDYGLARFRENGEVQVEPLKDWADYDASLNPERVKWVRRAMRIASFHVLAESRPRVALSSAWRDSRADSRTQINSFPINARWLGEDRVSWTEDLAALAFGKWLPTTLQLAIRRRLGNYRVTNVSPALLAALGVRDVAESPELVSLVVTPGCLGCGLRLRGRDGGSGMGRPVVIWLETGSSAARLRRRRDGLLARDLERF